MSLVNELERIHSDTKSLQIISFAILLFAKVNKGHFKS